MFLKSLFCLKKILVLIYVLKLSFLKVDGVAKFLS